MCRWLLLLGFVPSSLFGQSLSEFTYLGDPFDGYGYFGVALSRSSSQNPEAIRPDRHNLSIVWAELSYKHYNFKQGKLQYDLRGKMYTDVIKELVDQIGGKNTPYTQSERTGISTGPIGWHTVGFNAWSTSRWVVAPAIHANDYFYFSNTRSALDVNAKFPSLQTNEPQGYYFGAGPSVLLQVLASKLLLISVKSQYSFTYWRPVNVRNAIKDDAYPKPHFFGFTTEFMSPWGFFLEVDHNRIINRGDLPGSGQRTDVSFGFKFVVDN